MSDVVDIESYIKRKREADVLRPILWDLNVKIAQGGPAVLDARALGTIFTALEYKPAEIDNICLKFNELSVVDGVGLTEEKLQTLAHAIEKAIEPRVA